MNELITINPNLRMSSVEIAEVMDKRHLHVMRDIKDLIEKGAVDQSRFGLISYLDSMNREQPAYELDFHATMTLITGYDVKRRSNVIKRWLDLETGEAMPVQGPLDLMRALDKQPIINDLIAAVSDTMETVGKLTAQVDKLVQGNTIQVAAGPFINTSGVQEFLGWLPHEIGNGRFATKSLLYDLYSQYCEEEKAHQETRAHFFTKLYRCLPTLKSARIQSGGTRTQVVIGIKVLFGVTEGQ